MIQRKWFFFVLLHSNDMDTMGCENELHFDFVGASYNRQADRVCKLSQEFSCASFTH